MHSILVWKPPSSKIFSNKAWIKFLTPETNSTGRDPELLAILTWLDDPKTWPIHGAHTRGCLNQSVFRSLSTFDSWRNARGYPCLDEMIFQSHEHSRTSSCISISEACIWMIQITDNSQSPRKTLCIESVNSKPSLHDWTRISVTTSEPWKHFEKNQTS